MFKETVEYPSAREVRCLILTFVELSCREIYRGRTTVGVSRDTDRPVTIFALADVVFALGFYFFIAIPILFI